MLDNNEWYSKSSCVVKWGNCLSESFNLLCGIRQGGVLSPALFAVYVDDILKKLNSYGCKLFGLCAGSFMFADDLILLAPSVNELQRMINLCSSELHNIGLTVNCEKSICIRIGKFWHSDCCNISMHGIRLKWSSELKYLGVVFIAGKILRPCFDACKSKFYASFNSIYGKLGKLNSEIVTLNLIKSIALPCLLYGTEALSLNSSVIKTLDNPWSRVFMKIFSTFDNKTVKLCQLNTGFLSIDHLLRLRKLKFLNSLCNHNNVWLKCFYTCIGSNELSFINNFYGLMGSDFSKYSAAYDMAWSYFSTCIDS